MTVERVFGNSVLARACGAPHHGFEPPPSKTPSTKSKGAHPCCRTDAPFRACEKQRRALRKSLMSFCKSLQRQFGTSLFFQLPHRLFAALEYRQFRLLRRIVKFVACSTEATEVALPRTTTVDTLVSSEQFKSKRRQKTDTGANSARVGFVLRLVLFGLGWNLGWFWAQTSRIEMRPFSSRFLPEQQSQAVEHHHHRAALVPPRRASAECRQTERAPPAPTV